MSNLNIAAVVAALLAAATLFGARPAMTQDDKTRERTVSVSASGRVAADPDIAYISTGVVSEGDTAKEALSRNSAVMAKVIEGLKAAGIAAKDIQTTTLNIEPRYQQFKDGRPAVINGYRVMNQVRLTVREVKRLGELLDSAIALGANQVNRISFDVAEPEMLTDNARKQAIDNARRRAQLYAAAAGAQLGPVLHISENVTTPHAIGATARVALSAQSAPVEPGSRMLEVEVQVTWALR